MAQLTEEQAIGEVRSMLMGRGWQLVKQEVSQRAVNHYKALVAGKYAEGDNDDILRGRIQESEWFLQHFEAIVKSFDVNKMIQSQQIEQPPVGSPYAAGAEMPPNVDGQPIN